MKHQQLNLRFCNENKITKKQMIFMNFKSGFMAKQRHLRLKQNNIKLMARV